MSFEKSYARCWAEDVVSELGYDDLNDKYIIDYRNKKLVDWVLRWTKNHNLDPEQESVTTIADEIREDFWKYYKSHSA
jgi:hypothetical protein